MMTKIFALIAALLFCISSGYASSYYYSYDDQGEEYIWPTKGIITQEFDDYDDHPGIDIAKRRGQPVWASRDGVVIKAKYSSLYGNYVKIRHDNGDVTLYGHHRKLLARKGDQVLQGDIIGEMGSTGASTGPHLHFEIHIDGKARDPRNYLPKTGNSV
jgi:lysostaphin